MVCIQRKQWNEAGEYTDMKEMKWWMDIVKNLTMLTQFSFTLVTRPDLRGNEAEQASGKQPGAAAGV